jgi:hypothetical protein
MACINCGSTEREWTWFCPSCTAVKEAAYAEARRLGLNDYMAIVSLRDQRLREHTELK